ncbi:hypothetical protein [Roseateles koreensis]|uniref:Oligosaccharide repeat unit polymerase n=1 Tax=Roseateles koreensis TaxID=2987526 RepID=A0ABT5KUT6_9BURK|nr:hypothetical protein [Roseateles koreensis]MDC8786694.1 hypothetical protein [Roseateles koreensis]
MSEYIALAIFLVGFAVLIKIDTVYLIPMILLFFSNLNGLVGWESFALKGFVKFQDYGLLLVCCILAYSRLSSGKFMPSYGRQLSKEFLFNVNNIYWLFMIGLFIFSVFAMGSFVWAVKMGRTFFYGLVYYVICRQLGEDPLRKFEKVINLLAILTVGFGVIYIAYNKFGVKVYPGGEYESFDMGYLLGDVKRNFSGFPTFTYYFILLFTDRLIAARGRAIFNVIGLLVMIACVFFMLTRGALLLTIAMIPAMMLYRRQTPSTMGRILFVSAIAVLGLLALPYVAEAQYLALAKRFEEFGTRGLAGSENAMVRSQEFFQILKNVIDFDPLFGFGFMLPAAFGYVSQVYHGGSADNGVSNIIGVTGFVGAALFVVMILSWIFANIKLQKLKVEPYSRVNFIFIFVMLASMLNGATMSYIWTFALFMAYDLLALASLVNKGPSPDVIDQPDVVLSPIRF